MNKGTPKVASLFECHLNIDSCVIVQEGRKETSAEYSLAKTWQSGVTMTRQSFIPKQRSFWNAGMQAQTMFGLSRCLFFAVGDLAWS